MKKQNAKFIGTFVTALILAAAIYYSGWGPIIVLILEVIGFLPIIYSSAKVQKDLIQVKFHNNVFLFCLQIIQNIFGWRHLGLTRLALILYGLFIALIRYLDK